MKLGIQGTKIHDKNCTHTQKEIKDNPHIVLYLQHERNTASIKFHTSVITLEEELYHIWGSTGIVVIKSQQRSEFIAEESDYEYEDDDNWQIVFDIWDINQKLVSEH